MKLIRSFLPFCFAVTILCAQLDQGQLSSQLQQAAQYLQARNTTAAAELFRAVLRADPGNVEAHANLGVIAYSRNDFQQAAQELGRALSLQPGLVKVQALLGICLHRLGQPSGQKLMEESFGRLEDKSLKVEAGLELANLYSSNGDLDRAANLMQALVEIDPDNVDVLFMTQRLHTELADETMNKLAILAPNSARVQQAIAERLINAGDLTQAIEHYRKTIAINPKLPGIHFELAQAILQASPSAANVQAEAQRELQLAIETDGDSASVECALGRMALRNADSAAANAHFVRALQLNPHSAEAEVDAARMLVQSGEAADAVKYLRAALESDPLNSEAHYRLAAAYRKLGETEAAHREANLFEDIQQTKAHVRDLYQQMNKRAPDGMQEFTAGDADEASR